MADTGQCVPSYLMHRNEQNICTNTDNIQSQVIKKIQRDINYSLINIRQRTFTEDVPQVEVQGKGNGYLLCLGKMLS